MHLKYIICILITLGLMPWNVASEKKAELTLDQITKKYSEASGLKKMEKLQTLYMSGTVKEGGKDAPITLMQKWPKSFRVDASKFYGNDILIFFTNGKV